MNFSDKNQWVTDQLFLLALQLDQKITRERVTLYVESLSDIPQPKLESAFNRLRVEWRGEQFPPVPTIRELSGMGQEAELRAAWDEVIRFTNRYVDCDSFGNYGPEHGWHPESFPTLSPRILHSVRQVGGWKMLKLMNYRDEPFVQKNFFDAYRNAADVQIFPRGLLSQMPAAKELPAPTTPTTTPAAGAKPSAKVESIAKPVPAEQTPAEFQDRKEMLRQQVQKILAMRKQNEPPK